MGRKYTNPPLIEALCEIQFSADTEWNLISPGLIYEQVREQFPQPRPGRAIALNLSQAGQSFGQEFQVVDRVQFVRPDEQALIQVGPQLLVVNHLKPYPSWEAFRPLIDFALEAYTRVIQPTGIHRIGLRYINRIAFPQPRIRMEDYFEVYPRLGPELPDEHGAFIVGLQFTFAETRDALSLRLQTATSESESELAFIMDLDYFLAKPGEVAVDAVMDWVDAAHTQVEHTFEASITDVLRAQFGEVRA
jgi:uncharacterized protein (TIGR04255 family)